jgi:hypothetical protein
MADKSFSNELERSLARSDAEKLVRQIDVYIAYNESGAGDWPDEISDDLGEVLDADSRDLDKALAYVIIALSRTNDPDFISFMAASVLENALETTDPAFLDRVVVEAGKNRRFQWMLSVPYRVAISKPAWEAIKAFRITGEHEEPSFETFPGPQP